MVESGFFFFFFHIRGPERMLRIHCSLKAYCARPLYSILTVPTFAARYLSASYTTRELQAAKVELFVGEKLDR